jgi:predicted nucleic acid-binding protein
MFHLLIDTCVWLDLAKDHNKDTLLTVLTELIERKQVVLIVPQTIVDEFNRNKDHVAKDGIKSLSSAIKRAQNAVRQMGDPKKRNLMERYLGDISYKIPQLGDQAIDTLTLVAKLLRKATVIPTSDSVKVKAAQRGIEGKAPFHKSKNSINDAILIETYAEYKNSEDMSGRRFAIVTHNKHDFSSFSDERLPHPDIAGIFSKIKSIYSINLGETLRRIMPELVTDIMMESEFEFVPPTQSEILKAEGDLLNKIWYNRHHNWLYEIEQGEHRIIPRSAYKGDIKTTPEDIFQRARKAAKKLERKYPPGELGPWDDFEWGMLNGKLSALRWVLGEEWDSLDT